MISYQSAPKVIVGAGGAAWWVLEGFTRNAISVDGFVVTQEYGIESTCGLPVFSPSRWDLLPSEKSDYIAIIGIMNPEIDIEKITISMKNSGWKHVMTFSEFAEKLLSENQINVSMLNPQDVLSNPEALKEVEELLGDDESRECLKHFLNYVTTFQDDESTIVKNPYFPVGLPSWKSELRILDCGAFDGDTLRQAVENGYSIEAAICFEPDSQNFENLASNIKGGGNLVALPLAVGERTGILQFSAQSTSGSQVVKTGGITIQCVAIDDVIPAWNPNLIKMDIEGSEISALKGAEKTIFSSRPDLAISVYHKPTDIWFIPLWLKSILGDSTQFYLRRHSRAIADTVLYEFLK